MDKGERMIFLIGLIFIVSVRILFIILEYLSSRYLVYKCFKAMDNNTLDTLNIEFEDKFLSVLACVKIYIPYVIIAWCVICLNAFLFFRI